MAAGTLVVIVSKMPVGLKLVRELEEAIEIGSTFSLFGQDIYNYDMNTNIF
jgi:hypothetical protein